MYVTKPVLLALSGVGVLGGLFTMYWIGALPHPPLVLLALPLLGLLVIGCGLMFGLMTIIDSQKQAPIAMMLFLGGIFALWISVMGLCDFLDRSSPPPWPSATGGTLIVFSLLLGLYAYPKRPNRT